MLFIIEIATEHRIETHYYGVAGRYGLGTEETVFELGSPHLIQLTRTVARVSRARMLQGRELEVLL